MDSVNRSSPFHSGEHAVQSRVGVRDRVEPSARKFIRAYFPEQHRAFYEQLPFIVVAARDAMGRPWATILAGTPGFLRSPDTTTLSIQAHAARGDALADALVEEGADIGLLGIDLATRRRNRVNGRIAQVNSEGMQIAVDQTFGNCPQYIHERAWRLVPEPKCRALGRRSSRLTGAQRERIRTADTFFIATGHRGTGEDPTFGMDASHRGGEPGFVRIDESGGLVIPDYAGNNYFNTIGNLVMDPRAGLLFVDFENGGLLQLTGSIAIDWDSPALADFPGARRLLLFTAHEVVEIENALPLRWEKASIGLRPLRVAAKTRESDDVVSFLLEAEDGAVLPDFEPGQHLPVVVKALADAEPATRTYSLSNAPGEGRYRISVKRHRQGLVSRYLHDRVEVGDVVEARLPGGSFVLDHRRRPMVLLSAGVGVTPMMSMLAALVARDDARPVWFFHVARDHRHHPFAREVHELAQRHESLRSQVFYSRPDTANLDHQTCHGVGRLRGSDVERLLPDLDCEFYLCGPVGFMGSLQSYLEEQGVDPQRIHSESFGAGS